MDPLFVFLLVVCIAVLVIVLITVRQSVYEANSNEMFNAPEILIRRAEDTPVLEMLDVVEDVDGDMRGFSLAKAAPFVQYIASDNVPWRFMRELLEYGVALGYTAEDGSKAGPIARQVSIIFASEDIAPLWPHHLADGADRREAILKSYSSMLTRFVNAHPDHAGVEVCEPFITSGAHPYVAVRPWSTHRARI
jgi:hypothetical protein